MALPESSPINPIPSPAQVTHIRNHASYLLVGRMADRLFDAGWFFVGLTSNLVVVMPYLIVLALLLGRYHFSIINQWYWAVLIGAIVVFLPVWIVTQLHVGRLSSRSSTANVSRLFGRMILAFGISGVLILSCLTVEYLRDRFRFNELTLVSAIGGSGALLGVLGLLQKAIPEKLQRNQNLLIFVVSLSGALAVFMILVVLINWIVYGNTLEVAKPIKYLDAWSYFDIEVRVVIIASLIIAIAWLYRSWEAIIAIAWSRWMCIAGVQRLFYNGVALLIDSFLYLSPLIISCVFLFPYSKATKGLLTDAEEISGNIGKYSRSLNVFAEINPSDQLQISERTKRAIEYVRTQRNEIRHRQEYNHSPEDGGFKTFGKAHLKTFGVTQSYVDNAVELYELEASEKFVLRQMIAEQSRKLLLQRANLALGQTGKELTPANRWALVKPILVEQTALSLFTPAGESSLDPAKTLDEEENRLVSRLLDAKVNSLYQREFIDLFCPELADRTPIPASETSSFPGTIPVFFDGIDSKDRHFVRRAIGRSLIRSYTVSHPLVDAFMTSRSDIFPQIAAEEEIRKGIEAKTDTELSQLCILEPVMVPKVKASTELIKEGETMDHPVLKFEDNVPFTKSLPKDLGAWRCSIFEQLGIFVASWNRDLKPAKGDIARELLVERSLSVGSLSVDSLQQLQAPALLPSDDAKEKLTKYARRGKEQFGPRDLIRIAVAPFIGKGISTDMASQVAGYHQIDVVASTVAYSYYANLEKMASTRHELFTQSFGLKGFLISSAALIFGAFSAAWININRTTANEYYRAKLRQSFLTNNRGESLDVRLSDLNCPDSKSPYLLINAVVNLHGSEDLSLRDRKCDMFLLSPLYAGSRQTGYVEVYELEKADPSFKLSTAVAISAAAIGPNMGRFTSPPLVWLLSLLNIRLGYWVPNPQHLVRKSKVTQSDIKKREINEYLLPRRGISEGSSSELELIGLAFPGGGIRSATFNLGIAQAFSDFNLLFACDYLSTVSGGGYIGSSLVAQAINSYRKSSAPSSVDNETSAASVDGQRWYPPPSLLLKEMFSILREKDAWLNLSDGGHAENLAVFELLQRECKLIVVGNAEAGTANLNNGLGILIRMAKTDLDIDIVLDTSGFDLNKDLYCRSHWAVGRIHYPNGTEGTLVVLRASMTGDESVAISEYKERFCMFPFEPTTDQFFDVGQFEAYRLLGEHVAKDFLSELFPRSHPSARDSVSSRCESLLEAVSKIYAEHTRSQAKLPQTRHKPHGEIETDENIYL